MSEVKIYTVEEDFGNARIFANDGKWFIKRDESFHVVKKSDFDEMKSRAEKAEDQVKHYENVLSNKLAEQHKWLCEVFKSSEATFELFDRADLIANAEAMDKTQEAAHYNWLDDQNDKLEIQNKVLQAKNEKLEEQRDWYAKSGKFSDAMVQKDDKEIESITAESLGLK